MRNESHYIKILEETDIIRKTLSFTADDVMSREYQFIDNIRTLVGCELLRGEYPCFFDPVQSQIVIQANGVRYSFNITQIRNAMPANELRRILNANSEVQLPQEITRNQSLADTFNTFAAMLDDATDEIKKIDPNERPNSEAIQSFKNSLLNAATRLSRRTGSLPFEFPSSGQNVTPPNAHSLLNINDSSDNEELEEFSDETDEEIEEFTETDDDSDFEENNDLNQKTDDEDATDDQSESNEDTADVPEENKEESEPLIDSDDEAEEEQYEEDDEQDDSLEEKISESENASAKLIEGDSSSDKTEDASKSSEEKSSEEKASTKYITSKKQLKQPTTAEIKNNDVEIIIDFDDDEDDDEREDKEEIESHPESISKENGTHTEDINDESRNISDEVHDESNSKISEVISAEEEQKSEEEVEISDELIEKAKAVVNIIDFRKLQYSNLPHMRKTDFTLYYNVIELPDEDEIELVATPFTMNEGENRFILWVYNNEIKTGYSNEGEDIRIELSDKTLISSATISDGKFKVRNHILDDNGRPIDFDEDENTSSRKGHLVFEDGNLKIHIFPTSFENCNNGFAEYAVMFEHKTKGIWTDYSEKDKPVLFTHEGQVLQLQVFWNEKTGILYAACNPIA